MGISRRNLLLGTLFTALAASFLPNAGIANKEQATTGQQAMTGQTKPKAATIRFATWNMAGAAPGYHGRGLEGITQFVRDNNVDVISLQEVDRFSKMSHYADFPKYMEEKTGFHAFFAPSSVERPHEPGKPPREYGNCLLSRYPFLETHSFFLTGPDAPPDEPKWGEDKRIALLAKVEIQGRPVWIVGTHLSYTPGHGRSRIVEWQVKNLLTHIKRIVPEGDTLILGGDLNNAASAPDLAALSRAFNCATKNIGPTFELDYLNRGRHLNIALDHIFTRAATARNVEVHAFEQLSDHAGVTADIKIPPAPPQPST